MIARLAHLLALSIVGWQSLTAAHVNFTNLLPQGALVTLVKTDPSGSIYVAGTMLPFGTVFLDKISSSGTELIYNTSVSIVPIGGQSVGVTALAASPDGSAYLVSYFKTQPGSGGTYYSITKLDPNGTVLDSNQSGFANLSPAFASFIQDMTTDADGNLYATGTLGSISSSAGAVSNPLASGFVVKLDPNLNTVWSVAGYGGSHISVDLNGNAYVVGATTTSIPTTSNAFQTSHEAGDCGYSVDSVPAQNAPCAHQYVTAIDKSGGKLIYSTYLSGKFGDIPAGIVIDETGSAYVAGSTHSYDFPTTSGVVQESYSAQAPNPQFLQPTYSIFNSAGYLIPVPPVSATGYVAALDPSGTGLIFSTFFGGSATDVITAIALDLPNQSIEVGGDAKSPDLPGVNGAYRQCVPQSFIARLTLDGTAVARTVLIPALTGFAPGANNDISFFGLAGLSGNVSGDNTLSGNIDFDTPDSPIACLANSLDLSITNVVTPGQLLTIFGDQLGASARSAAPVDRLFPTSFSGVQVLIAGIPAPLLYVSPSQINLQVPFETAAQSQVSLQLMTTNAEGFPVSDNRVLSSISANPTVLQIADLPGDCPGSYLGQTETLVINADGSRNSCTNPASLSSTVTVFIGGLGTAQDGATTGSLNPSTATALTLPIAFATTNGDPPPAFVSAQSIPGAISGLYQIQLQLPASAPNGVVQASLLVNGYTAENLFTISVVP